MPRIRVFNPSAHNPGERVNPRRAKPWTEKQAADRKDKDERFERDVLEDDDRADEIADMTPEEYAEERGKEIIENPQRSRSSMKRKSKPQDDDSAAFQTNAKLAVSNDRLTDQLEDKQEEIDKLTAKNKALQSKLDEINDIVSCNDPECTAQEHLDDIADLIEGNGGDGDDDDDDDDGHSTLRA